MWCAVIVLERPPIQLLDFLRSEFHRLADRQVVVDHASTSSSVVGLLVESVAWVKALFLGFCSWHAELRCLPLLLYSPSFSQEIP